MKRLYLFLLGFVAGVLLTAGLVTYRSYTQTRSASANANVRQIPQPPSRPSRRLPMSIEKRRARWVFYHGKYAIDTATKYYQGEVKIGGASPEFRDQYAPLLSAQLKTEPAKRYFRIVSPWNVAGYSGIDYWTYDRRAGTLKFVQKRSMFDSFGSWEQETACELHHKVGDAAIHVLAEDKADLSEINNYTLFSKFR